MEAVVISPELIKKINQGEVNEFYILDIKELKNKLINLGALEKRGEKYAFFRDVGPEVERLVIKAVERIRDFLGKRIDSLKTANTNIAIIQSTVLLKFKELFWFLMDTFPSVGLEIHANYVFASS